MTCGGQPVIGEGTIVFTAIATADGYHRPDDPPPSCQTWSGGYLWRLHTPSAPSSSQPHSLPRSALPSLYTLSQPPLFKGPAPSPPFTPLPLLGQHSYNRNEPPHPPGMHRDPPQSLESSLLPPTTLHSPILDLPIDLDTRSLPLIRSLLERPPLLNNDPPCLDSSLSTQNEARFFPPAVTPIRMS